MRIARSSSPRRRKRLPSAKWSSTVCGSTLTTSMNASIALSGCSLRRKLRPLKYDIGSVRDSDTICLMSMRAAIQPSAKKSGRASSHQYSRSTACGRPGSETRDVGRWGLAQRLAQRVVPALQLALERRVLARLAHDGTQCGQKTERRAEAEEDEQHEDERRAPFVSEEVAHGDRVSVLHSEGDEEQKEQRPQYPQHV